MGGLGTGDGRGGKGEHTSRKRPDRRSGLDLALERMHDVVVDGDVAVARGWKRGHPGWEGSRPGSYPSMGLVSFVTVPLGVRI